MSPAPVKARQPLWIGLALCLAGPALFSAGSQSSVPDPAGLLETYARGAFDEALAGVRRMKQEDMRALRLWMTTEGRLWVEKAPADRSRRAFAVAAFAIDAEWARAELGEWMPGFPAMLPPAAAAEVPCLGSCLIEWACALLQERGPPDEAERVWLLASMALVGGVRDWSLLLSPLTQPGPKTQVRGHVLHALARFPDEPRFRLARAVAIASRLAVVGEMDTPRAGRRTGPLPQQAIVVVGGPGTLLEDRRRAQLAYAREQFTALVDVPGVGGEARMRLGYLDFRAGDFEQALAGERAAMAAGTDPDLRYIAAYIAAQAAQALGDLAEAERLYASALAARPHSQSAATGLAALQVLRGDAEPAYTLVEQSLRERPNDDDPWRTFLYGDFVRLAALLRDLRQKVAR